MTGEKLDLTALKSHLEGRDEIVAAYLFGSHARGEAGDRSDVDIALLLRPGLPDAHHLKPRLDTEIWNVLDSDEVDVLFLDDEPLPMQAEVIRTGRLIVSNDDAARVDYEVSTMNQWWDFKPFREMYWRIFVQRTKENFSDEQRRAYEEARRTFARAYREAQASARA